MIQGKLQQGESSKTGMRGRKRLACFCAAALLAACAAPKPPNQFEQDFDDQTKTWQEVQSALPPAPRDADLIAFNVSGASQYRFAIDGYTLTIGSDGVYRYVLVATSPQGSRNVTYEGIRCETGEKKLYATGQPDGTWVRSRSAAWTPIEEVGNNRQQAALMKEYFCLQSYPTRSVREILVRLNQHLPTTVW